MNPFLTDIRSIRREAVLNAMRPRQKVDYEKWAIKNVSFSDRELQFPGPYNPNRFRPFTEIYKALGPDDPCRIVTISKGAQIGGTIIATVFTLGTLDLDPGDFLYVHPTEENARRWSKLKLSPLLRGSARLREIFPEKAREGADSVMFKERYDQRGSLLISGANSAASLSQVSMKRQVQDDLAKWVPNSAGDPEGQADSRSSAFDSRQDPEDLDAARRAGLPDHELVRERDARALLRAVPALRARADARDREFSELPQRGAPPSEARFRASSAAA